MLGLCVARQRLMRSFRKSFPLLKEAGGAADVVSGFQDVEAPLLSGDPWRGPQIARPEAALSEREGWRGKERERGKDRGRGRKRQTIKSKPLIFRDPLRGGAIKLNAPLMSHPPGVSLSGRRSTFS